MSRKKTGTIGILSMLLLLFMVIVVQAETIKIPWPTDVNHTYKGGFELYPEHNGMDIKASSGTVLYAPFDGKATFYQRYRPVNGTNVYVSYGNYVEIVSTDERCPGYKVSICHMSSFSGASFKIDAVNAADYYSDHSGAMSVASWNSATDKIANCGTKEVYMGDIVGYSGSTGRSTGPHLHITLHKGSTLVDPYSYFDDTISAYDYARRVMIKSEIPTLYIDETNTFLWYVKEGIDKSTVRWKAEPSGIVEINNNGDVKGKAEGVATVRAYVVGKDGKEIPSPESRTITVKKPTIKMNYTTATIYGNETLQLKATVEGPSQTVTWKCSSSLYLSVDKNGLVKMGSMETLRNVSATITATANGVSATCKVTRVPGIIKFASDSVSMSAGGTRTVSVTKRGVSSVKYSSSNTAIATVNSSTGKVTAKKEGTVKITAAGGGVSASCTVKVSPTVKLNMSSATLYKGQTKKLTATVKGSSAKKKWKSSNSSVVSVSSSGKIKAKKAGTAKITVTIKGKNGTVSAACKVTVKKPTISLNKTSVTIKKGSTLSLKATVKGSSQKVTWKSSNKKVATVKNGKVTAKKAGTVTITAKANGVTAKCKVTVKNVPVTIKLSASSLTVYKGNTAALKATVTGSNSSVKWSSSNAAVASVSSKGKITGKSKGSTVITAKIGNVKAQCTVTVKLKSVSQRKTIDVAKYLRQDPSVAIAATGATPIYSSGSWRAVRDRGFVNSSYYTTLECAEFYSLSNSNKDGKINRIYLYMNRAASQESEIQEGDYSINGVYVNMKKEDAETVLENNGWKAVTLKELINLYQVDTDYNMYDRDYYIKKNDVMVLSESYDHYGRINTVSLYTREKMIEKLENS